MTPPIRHILSGSGLPTWLGAVSVIIGIACVLGPIGFIGTLAALLWFPVLGFVVGSKAKAADVPAAGAGEPVEAA